MLKYWGELMSVDSKEMKILWARAAGICSMPDCRKNLALESEGATSQNSVVGDNCHIVAKSKKGARGKSSLPTTDRDRYSNLILLCKIHHKLIDDDEKSWPIERLYQIKADQELSIRNEVRQLTN